MPISLTSKLLRDHLQTRFDLQICFWQAHYLINLFSCKYLKIQIFLTKLRLLTSGFVRKKNVETGHAFLHSNKISFTATSFLAMARNWQETVPTAV